MDFKILINQISKTDTFFKGFVSKSIDKFLSLRNWLIGYYIVEYEQMGADRANYGENLVDELSKKLSIKGLSTTNLKLFRQFYLAYPEISQTVSDLFENNTYLICQTLSDELIKIPDNIPEVKLNDTTIAPELLLNNLSFSHFVELVKIKDSLKRNYYEIECIKGTWSVRELKKQINSLSFERSANTSNPEKLTKLLYLNSQKISTDEIIETPFVFDFLGLSDETLASESDLEKALLNHLKSFMLELGHGFCFEAQQKKIIIGGEYYFIDLVFYHRILKCHVIIELKVDAFSHQHAGQLNTYLNYYKKNIKTENDNHPIGILLCTNKNKELVEYALGGMDKNLFVSQYQTKLPSTEQLEHFLKSEKENLNQ